MIVTRGADSKVGIIFAPLHAHYQNHQKQQAYHCLNLTNELLKQNNFQVMLVVLLRSLKPIPIYHLAIS